MTDEKHRNLIFGVFFSIVLKVVDCKGFVEINNGYLIVLDIVHHVPRLHKFKHLNCLVRYSINEIISIHFKEYL